MKRSRVKADDEESKTGSCQKLPVKIEIDDDLPTSSQANKKIKTESKKVCDCCSYKL